MKYKWYLVGSQERGRKWEAILKVDMEIIVHTERTQGELAAVGVEHVADTAGVAVEHIVAAAVAAAA